MVSEFKIFLEIVHSTQVDIFVVCLTQIFQTFRSQI